MAVELPVDQLRALAAAGVEHGGDRDQRVARRIIGGVAVEAVRILLGDEGRRHRLARLEAGRAHQAREKVDVVADAAHQIGIECGGLHGDRLGPGRGVGNELGDHRVVEAADLAALDDAGIDAHTLILGGLQARQPPGRWQEAAIRVLGIDARLDSVSG